MRLLESVQEMKQAARSIYGPRGWQQALQIAVHIVERGGMVYIQTEDPAKLDGYTRAMDEYIAKGDAFNMLDPMLAYGYYAVDSDGQEWADKPQACGAIPTKGGQDD